VVASWATVMEGCRADADFSFEGEASDGGIYSYGNHCILWKLTRNPTFKPV